MSKHNKIKLEMSLVFQKPATKLQSSSVLISKLGFFSYSSSPTRLSKSEAGWFSSVGFQWLFAKAKTKALFLKRVVIGT